MATFVDASREPPQAPSRRVWFERPVPGNLEDQGLMGVDMHFHTFHSDARVKVADALKEASQRGFRFAITDHNEISGVLEACRDSRRDLVIPGIEVSASDGPHVLLYFYAADELADFYARHVDPYKRDSPYLAIRLSTEEILERILEYNTIPSAAHPYGYLVFNRGVGRCVERELLAPGIFRKFGAVEVICGSMNRSGNEKACRLAARYGLGMVGGTDGHLLFDLGSVLTCAPAGDRTEFLDCIAGKRNSVIGQEKNVLEKGLTGTAVLTRFLPYTLPSLAIHYEQNAPRVTRFCRRAGSALHRRRSR
jgi:hypothetical protein